MREEEMGMTDLQFKSWLQQLISRLQDVKDTRDTESKDQKITRLIEEFEVTKNCL